MALFLQGKHISCIYCLLPEKKGAFRKKPPYITQDGEDRENAPDQYVAGICDGSTVGYTYFRVENSAVTAVEIRGDFHGKLCISTAEKGNFIGEITVDCSSSDTWKNIECCVALPDGVSGIFFTAYGKGQLQLNSFTLERK